ncbi:MAG: Rnf-Nqr domain containing protein [Acutalibacteraceae bacterium]|jgi:electron transport complex protein RnfE
MTEKNEPTRQRNLRDEVVQSLRTNGLYAAPVLSGAMGICVPVIAATTLRSGVILSLIFSLLLVPVCVLSSLCFAYLPKYLRIAAVVLTASVVFAGASGLVQIFFGRAASLYQIYAPLLIVSSLLISRADQFAVRQSIGIAAADSAACAIGFALVSCTVGAVRELLGSGTLYGTAVLPTLVPNRMAGAPFFGFIVLGFLAAAAKSLRLRAEEKHQR